MKSSIISKVAIIISLCIATVALVIGFVIVSKISNIKVEKNNNIKTKYSLYFDKDSLKETIVGNTVTDKKNTGVEGTNITGIIAFKDKGDSVTYTWNIINNGDVDAKLVEMPHILGLQDNNKEAIEYDLFINNKKVSKGTIIEAGDIAGCKMVIKYKKDSKTIIDPSTIQVVSTTFNFAQK